MLFRSLSADIIIKQTVSLSPEIVLEENTDIEAWDAVIETVSYTHLAYCNTKTAENGFLIVHAYQESK